MGANQRRTAARVVEDYFQRVYDRSGTRGLLAVGLVMLTTTVVVITAAVIFCTAGYFAEYQEDPVRSLVPYAVFGCVGIVVALLSGLLVSWRRVRVLLDWSEGPSSASRALQAWTTALALPRVLAVRAAIAGSGVILLNQALIYREFDLPWSAYPLNGLGIVLEVAAAAVASLLFMEYLFRPLTADVARSLPADFEPEPPPIALHTKAILPIPGVVLYTAITGSGLIDTGAGLTVRVAQVLGVALTIGVIAVALYYVLAHAFLDPIDQLTAATQRVQAGDLDTRVPVISGDELGGLAFGFNQMLDGLQERERLRAHNTELSTALDESLEEVRASRARIIEAADEERRRMERDLHDGAQQRLVMISLKVAMATDLLTRDPDGAAQVLQELRVDSTRAVDELRDLAHGIYPPLLESDGLASALDDIADQSPIPLTVEGDRARRYPSPVEAAVYFCCLEALQNAAKYAGPDCRAHIELSGAKGVLEFSVADDGLGFDISSVNGSAGLQNMKDRIGALGGRVQVLSSPGAGTRVEGTVPV